MSEVTVHLDDRLGRPRGAPGGKRRRAPKPSARRTSRLRLRWPGALRSRLVRRAVLAASGAVLLMIVVLAFPAHRVAQQLVAWSGQAGFRIDDIFVEGRVKTPRDQLLGALGVKRGDAILAVDLAAAQKRIEEIPWVRTAAVERRLPDQIHLLITERLPIALWQNKGRYFLIDHEGQIVGDQIDDYTGLPLTVGEGAPDHVADLIDLLNSEPTLHDRVKAAQWVGDRRWNITMDRTPDGIEIRLPEEGADAAWHDLAKLEKEQSLLERQVSVVDLRLPDRLVLRAANTPHEQAAGKRKPGNGKDA